MGYAVALEKAWEGLKEVAQEKNYTTRLLADTYAVNLHDKTIFSESCNVPAKENVAILILHYLTRQSQGLPVPGGEWIPFNRLSGGEGYHATFKKRVLKTIARKYGSTPEALLESTQRFRAKKAQFADVSIVLEVFDGIPLLITLQRGDDEFGPEANCLFDNTIKDILCTEDIVVLAELVAHSM